MSAIAGIVDFRKTMDVEELGGRIMNALKVFPSDDRRSWSEEGVFLGCHAQWITPESRDERLPFLDRDRRLVISGDAIIDNRDELFEIFGVDAGRRRTMTDSELIARAYERWGDDSPKHLVGDFAFLIWDMNKRVLFAARDFSGSRTLYFCRFGTAIALCSIVRPLLDLPGIDRKLNEQWLAEFLTIPTMLDVTDIHATVYQNVEQLPPSHRLTISEKGCSLERYLTLLPGEKIRLKSNDEYEEAFREVFGTAVNARLRTHRGIGAHLSGGLDSSSVVGFAAKTLRKQDKPLHTFSSIPAPGFEDWTPARRLADERPFIRSTVQFVGNVKDHYLSLEDRNCFSDIDEWLDTLEAPYKFFRNSYWLRGIYEKAHEHGIGVMLSGLRGNTSISWGPALDRHVALFRSLRWFRLYREVKLYGQNAGIGRKRLIEMMLNKAFPVSQAAVASNPKLIGDDLAARTRIFEKLEQNYPEHIGLKDLDGDEFRIKQYEQPFVWNITGTANSKMSLRYSLWDRDPTNDIRVIRFCLNLPEDQFVQQGMDRALIRRATKGYIPDHVRLNQRFRGIQSVDCLFRMRSSWSAFVGEIEKMRKDSVMMGLLNGTVIDAAYEKMRDLPQPEQLNDFEFIALMRSLIVYRFIKKLA